MRECDIKMAVRELQTKESKTFAVFYGGYHIKEGSMVRKKTALYFCPKRGGCGILQSCTPPIETQPGRQCKAGRCDDFEKCEIRQEYSNIDKFRAAARLNPDIRRFYRAERVKCNKCRYRQSKKQVEETKKRNMGR